MTRLLLALLLLTGCGESASQKDQREADNERFLQLEKQQGKQVGKP